MAELTEKRTAAQDQSERSTSARRRRPDPQPVGPYQRRRHLGRRTVDADRAGQRRADRGGAPAANGHSRNQNRSGGALRFTNFNQRTTPEFEGAVTRVSADAVKDDRVQEPYYVVRLRFARSYALKALDLLPDMLVDVSSGRSAAP